MVITTLTDELIEEGKKILEKIDNSGMIVDAALWLFYEENQEWKLVLGIPGVDREGPRKFYRKIQKFISKKPKIEHVALDVIGIAERNDPILGLIKLMVRTPPGIHGIRFRRNVINGILVHDAYIYRLL